MRNIVLIGFMGTGKTAIAKKIAEAAGLEYLSTDGLIIEKEGMPINDIFEKKGEPYFRTLEKNIVYKISELDNVVIDAGGGIALDLENIRNLRKKGVIVCLWADPKDIYERTKFYMHRPLLNVKNPLKKIKELLEARKPYYERADYHINTSSVSVDEAVEAIIKYARERQ